MGQGISAPKNECVSIQAIEELIAGSFTVKRTNGEMECGWVVPKEHHYCAAQCPGHCSAAAWKSKSGEEYVWRIFMRSITDDPNVHSCGWRRLETVEPTELSGNQEAIDTWRNRIAVLLETEEAKRLAENPPV